MLKGDLNLKRGTLLTRFESQHFKGRRNKEGVKGMHPLGCLPLWGREGVTLSLFFIKWAAQGLFKDPEKIIYVSVQDC